MTGPLLPLLTHVTLSAHPNVDPEPTRPRFSAQSHRFALAESQPNQLSLEGSKKDERDRRTRELRDQASKAGWGGTLPWERGRTDIRDRDELVDGITFPGLWVGEETGKSKEFRLELSIGQPGVEVDINGHPLHGMGMNVGDDGSGMGVGASMEETSQPLDEAALRHVLGSTSMEPLMNLSQAEHHANESLPELLPGVLDSDVQAAVAAAREEPSQSGETQLESQNQPELETQTQVDSQSQHERPPPVQMLLPPAPTPWATFVSDPLTIVSKPSQKTAKARSMASCLSANDAFALFVRVNAQTVRTKLLKLEGEDTDTPTLTARAAKWTPFRFEVVARASSPEDDARGARARFKLDVDQENNVVTYGSIVRLVDVTSGVKSDYLRLVRVDKNEVVVGMDVGHPVSELQRIGLIRVATDLQDDMTDGRRWYLSAPGALAGAGEVKTSRSRMAHRKSSSSMLPETLESYGGESMPDSMSSEPPAKRRKTKRHALAKAVIDEEEQGVSASGLQFKAAERRGVVDGHGTPTIVETVQDSMCWVLSSVGELRSHPYKLTTGCFSYTFFNGLGEPGTLPTAALDTPPRLLVNPTINTANTPATLQLTLSDFFVPDELGVPQPLSVYIGPLGPLRATTWRSVAPKEKYFDPRSLYDAIPWSGVEEGPPPETPAVVRSNFPHSVPHVIVSVELPRPEEILHAMQSAAADGGAAPNDVTLSADDQWLGVMGEAGELTIQEALHNAGKAAAPDVDGREDHHDMTAILGADQGRGAPGSEPKVDVGAEFEMDQLGQPLMDPSATLQQSHDAATAAAAAGATDASASASAPTASGILGESLGETEVSGSNPSSLPVAPADATISMYRPDRIGAKDGAPLPLLLVRPDGVGHGIGWSIERVQSGQEGSTGHIGTGGEASNGGGAGGDTAQVASGAGFSDWGEFLWPLKKVGADILRKQGSGLSKLWRAVKPSLGLPRHLLRVSGSIRI